MKSIMTTRLAEIALIILCTCFPMMPHFVKLVKDRYFRPKPPSPMPNRIIRKSRIVKVGNAQNSIGISGEGPQEADKVWLKSPHGQLGDEEGERAVPIDVIRDLGIKKTVDIEMASWDQLNAKSRVASMV